MEHGTFIERLAVLTDRLDQKRVKTERPFRTKINSNKSALLGAGVALVVIGGVLGYLLPNWAETVSTPGEVSFLETEGDAPVGLPNCDAVMIALDNRGYPYIQGSYKALGLKCREVTVTNEQSLQTERLERLGYPDEDPLLNLGNR